MKNKKSYCPAKATFVIIDQDDAIRTSAFNGPGDPLFPTSAREQEYRRNNSEMDNI